MKRTCKQCGKEFTMSQSEIDFYKSKNLNIPKRCKACRETNRQVRQNTTNTERIKYQKNENANDNTSRSSTNSSLLTKIMIIVGIVLLVIFGAWTHFSGDQKKTNEGTTTYTVKWGENFRTEDLLNEHYQKHGVEMGFASAMEYEAAARSVVENDKALQKTEAEDGDMVYYLESTNELVIVSTDGYIRTYFKPDDGIEYFNRQ